jgi:hypothetical protein
MVWWPTKGAAPRAQYVGTQQCAKCHYPEASSQILTEMAKASTRAADLAFLDGHHTLSFRQGAYSYEIARSGDAVAGSVRNRDSLLTRPLLFAFGKGIVGQTYIYQKDGNLFEGRVSYYPAIKGLDLTTGHLQAEPPDLEQAFGRRLDPQEAQRCFGCHTTASRTRNIFDPNQSVSGVTCEACHGPGSKHVQAMMAGQIERGRKLIFSPKHLDPASSVDFCGACHRTFGDVIQMNTAGVVTVRFQPFRLEESRCWNRANGRLTCVTCHNPHQPLVRDFAYYDQVCLHCHSHGVSRGAEKSKTVNCKVSSRNCVSCHMPKVEIPGMHHAFVDHWIRITKPDMPYPN